MTAPARLVTTVDAAPGAGAELSVEVRHELELVDGRRVVLLDDRGWGSSQAWADSSAADVERTSRTVVGPDEPFGDVTAEDMTRMHWEALARAAQEQGASVVAADLQQLPHDVVLSERLLELVHGTGPGLAPRPLDTAYLRDLLVVLADRVGEEQSDPARAAWLEVHGTDLAVVVLAGGRRLAHGVEQAVGGYEPDGNDPSLHGRSLAQLFDEEAEQLTLP